MKLPLELARAELSLKGFLGDRMRRNIQQWLRVAPLANPAMVEMFRLRERSPRVPLVPWYGEFPGKHMSSAALAYRMTGDRGLREVVDRLVDELADAQSPDGYLGPHPDSERLTGFTEGTQSMPRRKLWDIWGHYQMLLGLLMWHEASGNAKALNVCLKAADLICREFIGKGVSILEASESDKNTAIIHVLCLLHQKTGKPEYLAMARSIEASWDDPEGGGYITAGLEGVSFFETRRPRWESLHGIQGIFELFRISGDPKYATAFQNLWWSITRFDRHNTGGFSSGEKARGNPYDPRPIETCCTVAWMALTQDMLRMSGDSLVADELELSALNAMLASQHPSGRWWTYNTPMDGVRKASAHDIVFQALQGSPELNCCSVNGPRGLGMFADWALMASPRGFALNFYGPCRLRAALPSGRSLEMRQITRYPVSGAVRIEVGLDQDESFELKLRIPAWSRKTRVSLNGQLVRDVTPGQYLGFGRTWRNGDTIEISFDMSLHFWAGEKESAGKVSIYRGPLLLAYDQRFNAMDADRIPAIDRDHLRYSMESWKEWPRPWLLLAFPWEDGSALRLCDFATAGTTGGRYASWLPSRGFEPVDFDKKRPVWNTAV